MPIYLYSMKWSPPCRAVLLLAEDLGIQLEIKPINTRNKEQMKEEFIKVNPQHTVPTLDDNGFILWESRAIMGYLVDKYARDDSLYPRDAERRAVVNQRLYFDMHPLFDALRNYFVPVAFHGEDPYEPSFNKLRDAVAFLDKFLEGSEWAAGDNMTIADYTLAVSVADAQAVGLVLTQFPNVSKWFNKMKDTAKGSEEHLVTQSQVFGHLFMKNLKTK